MNEKEIKVVCVCPDCGCSDEEHVRLLSTNRKVFTAAGAGVGGVTGWFARQAGSRIGMAIGAGVGSAVPGVGTVVGAAAGGIAGAVAGLLTGAAVGNIIGAQVDSMVGTYRCNKCGKIFEV